MASRRKENNLGSDSDESYITEVTDEHLDYLKSRIIHYLSEMDTFSAHILHVKGQPAQMKITLGEEKGCQYCARKRHQNLWAGTGRYNIPEYGQKTITTDHLKASTNKILVKNLPRSSDKDHLQMFFEYEKGQGGGPVKNVTINDDHTAVVEFEEAKAVNVVLSKQPIKMLGVEVKVMAFVPYLDHGESLKSFEVNGLPSGLIEDIAKMHTMSRLGFRVGDRVRVKRSVPKPKYMYQWGGVSHDSIGTILRFEKNGDLMIRFPEFSAWQGHPSEMELVH